MKTCKNCRSYYLRENESCFNCGASERELRRYEATETVTPLGLAVMVLMLATMGITLAFLVGASLLGHDVIKGILFFLFFGASIIPLLLIFHYLLGLRIFRERKDGKPEQFISENYDNSLLKLESDIQSKIKILTKKIVEMRDHKKSSSLGDVEVEALIKAEENLIQRKHQIQTKLNSFPVARFINEAQLIFSLSQPGIENQIIDLITNKINVARPKGRAMLKLDLDEDVKKALTAALDDLGRFQDQLTRAKSLNFIQSVRDDSDASGERIVEIITDSEPLLLTDNSINGINTDAFLKEKYRLDVLGFLTNHK